MTNSETIEQLLDRLKHASRGQIKREASRLSDSPEMILALIEHAVRRGVTFPEEAEAWSVKRVLRHALDRQSTARVRSNPIRCDEAFTCMQCQIDVAPHGRTARNHCPQCLSSRHVDVVPGDRTDSCGGEMPAISVENHDGGYMLTHRCQRCGFTRRNRALLDGDPSDSLAAIGALSTRAAP